MLHRSYDEESHTRSQGGCLHSQPRASHAHEGMHARSQHEGVDELSQQGMYPRSLHETRFQGGLVQSQPRVSHAHEGMRSRSQHEGVDALSQQGVYPRSQHEEAHARVQGGYVHSQPRGSQAHDGMQERSQHEEGVAPSHRQGGMYPRSPGGSSRPEQQLPPGDLPEARNPRAYLSAAAPGGGVTPGATYPSRATAAPPDKPNLRALRTPGQREVQTPPAAPPPPQTPVDKATPAVPSVWSVIESMRQPAAAGPRKAAARPFVRPVSCFWCQGGVAQQQPNVAIDKRRFHLKPCAFTYYQSTYRKELPQRYIIDAEPGITA
ncbi:hypothetical protein DIPPA_16630 [Diplonema papillatum]|nr:hypothetical protein DIPPA_16630 [Diplonema papillatum]